MSNMRAQANWYRERLSCKTQRVISTFLFHGACLRGLGVVDILMVRDQGAPRGEWGEGDGLLLQVFDEMNNLWVIRSSDRGNCLLDVLRRSRQPDGKVEDWNVVWCSLRAQLTWPRSRDRLSNSSSTEQNSTMENYITKVRDRSLALSKILHLRLWNIVVTCRSSWESGGRSRLIA